VEDPRWGLVLKLSSSAKSFIVYAASPPESEFASVLLVHSRLPPAAQQWADDIQAQLSKLEKGGLRKVTENRAARPIWKQDNSEKVCPLCRKQFTFTFRRHHCRMCGCIVCVDCSKGRKVLSEGNKPARVCDKCNPVKKEAEATELFQSMRALRGISLKKGAKEEEQKANKLPPGMDIQEAAPRTRIDSMAPRGWVASDPRESVAMRRERGTIAMARNYGYGTGLQSGDEDDEDDGDGWGAPVFDSFNV
jgi:hypothetical protein